MILGPWLDQDTLDDVRTKLAELENEVGKVSGWDGNPTEPEKIADRLVILLDHWVYSGSEEENYGGLYTVGIAFDEAAAWGKTTGVSKTG